MRPALAPGDVLVLSTTRAPRRGDIVVFSENSGLLLVKRITRIVDGILDLTSDNQFLGSSLELSNLPIQGIVGKVVMSFSVRRCPHFKFHY